jgi:hypothetical protein
MTLDKCSTSVSLSNLGKLMILVSDSPCEEYREEQMQCSKDSTFPTAGPPSSLGLQNEGAQCTVADAASGTESSLCL